MFGGTTTPVCLLNQTYRLFSGSLFVLRSGTTSKWPWLIARWSWQSHNKNYYLWSTTTNEVCHVNEPTDLSGIVGVLRDPDMKDRELNITYYIGGSHFEDNSWVTFGLDTYGARFLSEYYGLYPGRPSVSIVIRRKC